MIYNCYVSDNRFCVDIAKSDSEVVTRKFPFSMKLGLLSDEPGYEKNRTPETMDELYTGKKLRVYEFSSLMKYKSFTKEMKDRRPVFGDIDPIYHCLTQHFKEPLPVFNPRFYTLDIEVYSKSEFPEPDKAEYVMNLVTICDYQNQKYYTWGLKPFTNESEFGVEYCHCRNELELMESLIEFFETENIKCMTGWNTLGFDVPYIINRFRKFTQKSDIIADYVENHINLYGKNKSFKKIQVIDYMELYKKFKDKKLERYSLDFVSVYEGFEGKKKLVGRSLAEASDNSWYDYVLYNIIDNYKIVQLENKLKYIKQAFSMANDNRCLPTDVYSPVKMWDAAVYFELYHRGILVPPLISEPPQKLMGGYVGQPELAIHKYVSVFDIGSSYPHQIMQFNISPECLVSERRLPDELRAIRERFTPPVAEMKKCPDPQFQKEWQGFTKDLWKKFGKRPEEATAEELNIFRVKFNVYRFSLMFKEDMSDVREVLVRHNVTMTPNLQFYRKDRQGIFPELMQRFFGIRNIAKRNVEALEFHIDQMKKQLGIRIEEEKLSSFDDAEYDEEEELEEELLEEVVA